MSSLTSLFSMLTSFKLGSFKISFCEAIKFQHRFHPFAYLGPGEEILEVPRPDPGGRQEDDIRLV